MSELAVHRRPAEAPRADAMPGADPSALASRLARVRRAVWVAGLAARAEIVTPVGSNAPDAAHPDGPGGSLGGRDQDAPGSAGAAGFRRTALTLVAAIAAAAVVSQAEAASTPAGPGQAASSKPVDPAGVRNAASSVMGRSEVERRVAQAPSFVPSTVPSSRRVIPSVADAVAAADPRHAIVGVPLLPVQVSVGGRVLDAVHPMERVRLCKEVARQEGLTGTLGDWRDIYAVVSSETAWAPRDGIGHNGRISRGLAQLEDATSRALGVSDPYDPRQALTAVARLVKESRQWALARGIRDAQLAMAATSVYYNLSTAARNAWDGRSVEGLPPETQYHVANLAYGVREAERMGKVHERFVGLLERRPELVDHLAQAQRAAALMATPLGDQIAHTTQFVRTMGQALTKVASLARDGGAPAGVTLRERLLASLGARSAAQNATDPEHRERPR